MDLNKDIQHYLGNSVLCWLATVSSDNIPNVSPKEIFSYYPGNKIIIANIASPNSIKNIKQNKNVCLSFIDILVQKGYQIKGTAEILTSNSQGYKERETRLVKMTENKFPFKEIIEILTTSVKPIIAPKYILYPETTEADQIEAAKVAYRLE